MKSRFCPSPTGLMHLGNARTALFNLLCAMHEKGTFLLRIEDSDQTRSEQIFVDALYRDMAWLHLNWDEGPLKEGKHAPYFQSQRHEIYDRYYKKLEELGDVYPCFCSDEQLALNRKIQRAQNQPPRYPGTCKQLTKEQVAEKIAKGEKPTLRFKVEKNQIVEFDDFVRGKQVFKTDDIGDFVIRRADGTASFMFCNAIDDSLMGVTHALRGEDHLTNTPRQLLILKALNMPAPRYGHMALILGADGSPLSKRNGSRSIEELRNMGYLPLAILNYLARLGHHYAENHFLNLQQLAEIFSIEALQKSPARFDEQQLRFWQHEAVMNYDEELLWQWMGADVHRVVPKPQQKAFIDLVRPNIDFPQDALLWAEALFNPHLDYSHDAKQIIKTAGIEFFQFAVSFIDSNGIDYKKLCVALTEKFNVKGKALFQPLRIALTGELHGPELAGVMQLLGIERVKERFEHAIFTI